MKFKFRRYYLYYLARTAAFFIYLIPLKISLYMAALLGRLAFLVLANYRRIAIENLRFALGKEKTEREIYSITEKVFENIARNAVELVNFPKINKSNVGREVGLKNRDVVDKAFEKGKGVIILTAHFGNWELVGAAMRMYGFEGCVIGRRIYFSKYDKWLNSLRKVHDVNIIYRDESPRKMLKVLKDNKVLGMLADQDVDSVEGVFVDFFGRKAYTPVGPVAIAKASGAALIPTFIVRDKSRHTIIFEKPVELVDTGDKDKDIVENTRRWSSVVESYVRKYPDLWVWMHRRWKTRPA